MTYEEGIAAGMRRAAELVRGWRNDVPMTGEECANAILAAIPAAGACEPPADRKDGFECMGEFHGERFKVQWKADLGGYGLWFAGTLNRFIAPTAFWPLPPAPAGEGKP